mgnify:CR=1 FL=1|tara:strand:+ start:122513 stop:123685 length:1173 start_codon:yes stop_codon:yes gene_type:complete
MKHNRLIFILVLFVACLQQFAADIYAPSVPAIAKAMSAPMHMVQYTMAIFMFGVGLSTLFYGIASEGFGRKKPLIVGLLVMLAGSVVCVFAQNVETLLVGRFIQGCGCGATAGLWRTIFRDQWQGDEMARMASYFTMAITLVLPIAPVIGGYLQELIGWQASFGFLAVYVILLLIVVMLFYTETSQHHHLERLKPKFIWQAIKEVLTHREFLGYIGISFLCFGGLFSWFIAGPVIIIHVLKYTPAEFGWMTLIATAIAMLFGGKVNAKYVKAKGAKAMMKIGFAFMLLSGLIALVSYFIVGNNVYAIMTAVTLFYFSGSLVWPNAFANAMTPFGKIAGFAGPIYSAMQISGAAVIGAIVAYLPSDTVLPVAIVFIVVPMLAWLLLRFVVE